MNDYDTTHIPEDDAVVYENRDTEADEGRDIPDEDVVRRVVSCQCEDCVLQALVDDEDEAEELAREHLDDVDPDPEGAHVIDILPSPKTRFN